MSTDKQMTESNVAGAAAAQSRSVEARANEPATYRLVIRAEILPDATPQTEPPSRLDRRAISLIVGMLALLLALAWIGFTAWKNDPTATSAGAESVPTTTPTSSTSSAPVVGAESQSPAPIVQPSADRAAGPTDALPAQSVASEADPNAPPATTNEVIPNASRGSLQTIRGTIRVSIRVTIDKQGTVVAATSEVPGPSRYFERLALEAARKWTFVPTISDEARSVVLRFNFTRDAVTAQTNPRR